ncbi:hypothetical protein R1sor_006764 [Riccia sorocarpa]|uniref:DUF7796 domain-containing protein n=1 Tax=Riccia sorocarpa TaxID=122646 RepID=A0ABD3HNV0_9MARC
MATASWKKREEGWLLFTLGLIVLGMIYWLSPSSELRQTQWTIRGFPYEFRKPCDLIRPPDSERVAICLVGGARAFELTGPSIKHHLLGPYEGADVFVHAPIDGDAHKLSLLDGAPRLAAIRLFEPTRINQTRMATELLTARGSPHGIQGLLQYFRLVEGCLNMIEEYEALNSFQYKWVIRTRVDGYWNAPMPPVDSFDKAYYYVPYGSEFGGFNDRLGIGSRETSTVALARLSLLSKIHELGYRELHSESAFASQFEVRNVEVKKRTFPFCVLSARKYSWPPRKWGVPVLSIGSKGPLNGAKCRPCTPKLVGKRAEEVVNASERLSGWIGPTEDPKLCNAAGKWENGWENIFDKIAGEEAANARQKISSRTFSQCIQEIEEFRQKWKVWDAPSAEVLCQKGSLVDS